MVSLLAAVMSAVLCVGIVLMVRFMASVSNRLKDLRDAVDKRFADVGEATRLFGEVERLRGDGGPRLAAHATEIVSVGPDILHRFAHEEINRLAVHLEALTRLATECPGENHDWLLTLTGCARESIDALSTTLDEGFWDTEPAARCLAAEREAVTGRGISVRRLFVVRRRQELDALAPFCAEQRKSGIRVRTAVLEELGPFFRRGGWMTDFIVFDGELSYQVRPEQFGVTSATTIDARMDHVESLVRRFDLLWNAAASADG
jgi:hypothetical protein